MKSRMINAIIVDDEYSGRNSLKLMIEKYCPSVVILEECSSLDAGIESIRKRKPDLVFLDIEINGRNGFELFDHFDDDVFFKVIFVTAYDRYAIKAIRFNALDYLLKPVNHEELNNAISKYTSGLMPNIDKALLTNLRRININRLAVPIRDGFIFIDVDEIVRCEADINYSIIYINNGTKIVSSKTLGYYEEILDQSGFMRIHKSHLINMSFIKMFSKSEGGVITMTDGAEVPISKRQRDEFLRRVTNYAIG